MTMITPSYLGETIEYSSLHACRSTLEDPTTTAAARPSAGASEFLSISAFLPAGAIRAAGHRSERDEIRD